MVPMMPDPLPKPGDAVEVEHEGEWQEALVTDVSATRVMGFVIDRRRAADVTRFSYCLDSYRHNWRWSQRHPSTIPPPVMLTGRDESDQAQVGFVRKP